MELDLQSLFGLHVQCRAILIGWDPPTPLPHLGIYKKALLVSKNRRHHFVTPWDRGYVFLPQKPDQDCLYWSLPKSPFWGDRNIGCEIAYTFFCRGGQRCKSLSIYTISLTVSDWGGIPHLLPHCWNWSTPLDPKREGSNTRLLGEGVGDPVRTTGQWTESLALCIFCATSVSKCKVKTS